MLTDEKLSGAPKPRWYTDELETILGLLADTLNVPRYNADALLVSAKERVAYVEQLVRLLRWARAGLLPVPQVLNVNGALPGADPGHRRRARQESQPCW